MPEWPSFDHWFPPVEKPEPRPAPPYSLRNPLPGEHVLLLDLLAGWLERPALPPVLAGLLLREQDRVSWLAETDAGRIIGLLLGLIGPDRPDEAAIALVGVEPAMRRRGIGRALVDRFVAEAEAHGPVRVVAALRPDEPIALAFFAALGFEPEEGPGSARIHGIPAIADWDGPGQDRAILVRAVRGA